MNNFPNEAVLAVVLVGIVMVVRVLRMMTVHQQRMTEILHSRNPQWEQQSAMQIEALRREVGELKALVHQQVISSDNLSQRLTPPTVSARETEAVNR